MMFRKLTLFPFSGKEAPNLTLSCSQSLGTIETVTLRYEPENRSSPKVATGKWLLKN